MTLEARFWSKVAKAGPDECWLWQAAKNSDGYGVIRTPYGLTLAHRLSLVLAGRDPVGFVCRHRRGCGRACVNPAHLTVGTIAENVADAVAEGAYRGERNSQSRLRPEDVLAIRAATGESRASVAARFGIAKGTVRAIQTGARWGHLAEAA